MIYHITVCLSAILMLVASLVYVRGAWHRQTEPVITTWILGMVTMSLSLGMYLTDPESSITANIALSAGVVNMAIILGGVIIVHIRDGRLWKSFDPIQRWCLAGATVITMVWYLTKEQLVSYILIQLLMIIAYIPTVAKLWGAKKCSEPLFTWVASLLATLTAIYPAWTTHDTYSWIYLGRAIPSVSLVIYLIAQAKRRENRCAAAPLGVSRH